MTKGDIKEMIDWAFSKDNPNQEYNKKTLGSKKALYKDNKIKDMEEQKDD
jgi:hypothetical protein